MHDFVSAGKPAAPSAASSEGQHVKIPYVTPTGDFVESFVKVQKHTADERGLVAQKLAESIVGFCSGCRMQATLTFPNGADHKDCDRAIQGKAMKALCPRCQKVTEFLPAATYFNHPLVQRNQDHVREAKGLSREDLR
jgi:hypothetical protein